MAHPHSLWSGASLALLLLTAAACKHRAEAVEPPPWQSEEGVQETRLGIAERMLGLGYSADALTLLHLAREDGESGPTIDKLTGHALYLEGQLGEAELLLQSAAEDSKRDPEVHRLLGLVYADSDRPEKAIANFERALELDDTDAATWNNLGFLLYAVKRSPDAVPALRKAVSLDGTQRRYRRNLGFALFNQGDIEGAEAAFGTAGSPADTQYNLGLAHELAGDDTEAATRYERAIELDPDHPKAREALRALQEPATEDP